MVRSSYDASGGSVGVHSNEWNTSQMLLWHEHVSRHQKAGWCGVDTTLVEGVVGCIGLVEYTADAVAARIFVSPPERGVVRSK